LAHRRATHTDSGRPEDVALAMTRGEAWFAEFS
jgi:hypothetical protein